MRLIVPSNPQEGIVYFVGAGPGDPELLTLKAQRLIAQADVILYAGSLVNPTVLARARSGAALYDSAEMKLADQVGVMSAAARQGQTVVRLHTGDPSIYGAIFEQMRELDSGGVAYRVVPGVSSAFAAAAALGIEYTLPGDTQTVIFTRLAGRTPVPEGERLRDLAAHRTSLVLFLSAGMVPGVVDELDAAGYAPETPVAMVFRASWPDERIVRGTLADIAGRVEADEITHHALIIVSPALRPELKGELAQDSHLYGSALDAAERAATIAIITLTRGGTDTGQRLHALLPLSVLFAPARFLKSPADSQPSVVPYTVSVRQVLQSAFRKHSALVCIMSSGIVVRDLAPLLRSKHADPAVVVMDERGLHAVSLLSGHIGGANDLARQVARLLGGTPVLTTASDVRGLPALDTLGSEYGWVLTRVSSLTALIAAMVNGQTVGVMQEAGDESWWPEPPSEHLFRFPTWDALVSADPAAALAITHRQIPSDVLAAIPHTVVYHPRCLVVGVGCNRGTPSAEIGAAIDQTLAEARLAGESVAEVATVEDKADEPGLLALCAARQWPLRAFSRDEIGAVPDLPNPSVWAHRALGVPGVAEPAALLGAGARDLLLEKRKFLNVTVAVAKRES